jgi:uncharacterized protein (TIGR03086 family)
MSEITDKYRTAVSGFSAVVDAVPADKWAAPSPCERWTAKHVVGHVIGGMGRISGNAADGPDPAELAGDNPAASYTKARDAALTALTPDNLAKIVAGPTGEMPLEQFVAIFLTPDVLVHTWDLARAAGQTVTLDEGLVKEAYDRVLPMDAMIRMPGVFGPKVDPPADADLQTELLCFLGRPA